MPAAPADIALYTNDGVVITSPTDPAVSAAIAGDNIDARTGAGREIEMFFASASDAQAMLDERFAYLSKVNPVHLGIEVEDALALGDTIAVTPQVPTVMVIDDTLGIAKLTRLRAYAHDMSTDRFSLEVIE